MAAALVVENVLKKECDDWYMKVLIYTYYKKMNRGFYMENKWNIGQGGELPIGFGLSLAANEKSMETFSEMSDMEKAETVEASRKMNSRDEMEEFVNKIGENPK